MKKEYDFSKGRVNKKPLADPKTSRVSTSIRLDGNVFQWFMVESERTGIPYQTLINSTLKQAVETSTSKNIDERLQSLEKAVFKKTGT
ncbi:MAG: hypothetical protein WCG27_12485 [Pseudomonadota bacterium]